MEEFGTDRLGWRVAMLVVAGWWKKNKALEERIYRLICLTRYFQLFRIRRRANPVPTSRRKPAIEGQL